MCSYLCVPVIPCDISKRIISFHHSISRQLKIFGGLQDIEWEICFRFWQPLVCHSSLIVTPYNEVLRLGDTRIWVLNNLSALLSLISSFQMYIISYLHFVGRLFFILTNLNFLTLKQLSLKLFKNNPKWMCKRKFSKHQQIFSNQKNDCSYADDSSVISHVTWAMLAKNMPAKNFVYENERDWTAL